MKKKNLDNSNELISECFELLEEIKAKSEKVNSMDIPLTLTEADKEIIWNLYKKDSK